MLFGYQQNFVGQFKVKGLRKNTTERGFARLGEAPLSFFEFNGSNNGGPTSLISYAMTPPRMATAFILRTC